MRHAIALIFALLLVGTSASARDTDYDLPIQEDLESELGKQKLLDSGGRVERFQRRLEKAGGARRG